MGLRKLQKGQGKIEQAEIIKMVSERYKKIPMER
jgi:hypothetical protein